MHAQLRALAAGTYVRLRGVENARQMIVMEVKGRSVRCVWSYHALAYSDWFCASGLEALSN